jgi:ketosteroid isomerase-like protein
MKRTFAFAIFSVLVASALIWSQAQTNTPAKTPGATKSQSNDNDKAKDIVAAVAVASLEQQWAEAQKVGDAQAVAPLLAEGFVNTDIDGQTYGKEKLLASLKGGQWEPNGISDVKVVVFGNTAIATGVWVGKGVAGDGAKIDRRERWTDTWIKMPSGKWQCVASQQTAVKP